MRVAYANARFRPDAHDGANAHVRQFVVNTVGQGHELWMWPGAVHPLAKPLPSRRLPRMLKLREMDLIYVRVEHDLPNPCTWTLNPARSLLGNPMFAWEFNTVPEYGEYRGLTKPQIQGHIEKFKHYGTGCDLAVCVSEHLARYVRDSLGIRRTVVIPNGSDPDLYRPDVPPMRRMSGFENSFNVLWIGSAYVAWHNFKLLSEAAGVIYERGNRHNIVFHLIGQGMASMGDMPPNVHYYGMEDYEKLPNWMSAMDVGLCLYRPGPADYSSPLKVFDYMMSGLCVVTTEQPQCRELFEQLGQTDLLMPPEDAVKLADALESLASDPGRVEAQAAKSRELAIARYTWRRAVSDTFAEVQKLSNGQMR